MPKKGHQECRKSVCLLCLKNKGTRLISQNQTEYMTKNVLSSFMSFREFLPCGICETCKKRMTKKDVFEYLNLIEIAEEVRSLYKTRSVIKECSYPICKIVQADHNYFQGVSQQKDFTSELGKTSTTFICDKCFQNVANANHKCNKTVRFNNLMTTLSSTT